MGLAATTQNSDVGWFIVNDTRIKPVINVAPVSNRTTTMRISAKSKHHDHADDLVGEFYEQVESTNK